MVVEHWGVGRFAGGYPTKDGPGIFAGTPVDEEIERQGPGRRHRIQSRFAGMGAMVDAWLSRLPDDDAEMYYWHMSDVRSAEWLRNQLTKLYSVERLAGSIAKTFEEPI